MLLPYYNHFQTLFGRNPEHVLQHGLFTFGGVHHYTLDEADKWYAGLPDAQKRFVGNSVEVAKKLHNRAITTPHHQLVREALGAYRSGPNNFMASNDHHMLAARIVALNQEFQNNRRTTDVPLYRGAKTEPEEELKVGRGLLSFSENKPVAKTFAKENSGSVFELPAGQAEGLRMEDYNVAPMKVQTKAGNLSEAEWLISHINNRGQQLR